MKRRGLAALCALVLLAALLTACGGSGGGVSGGSTSSSGSASNGSYGPAADMAGSDSGFFGWDAEPSAPMEAEEQMGYGGGEEDSLSNDRLKDAKMIYTANLEMETTSFEDCASGLETLVEQLGGYMEYASVNNYGNGYRSGSYTIRIPAGQFERFLQSVGEIGHVVYQDKRGENISEAYYDTESRLTTQRIKLERLQALLSRADNMADLITIESAIAETELEIEQLTGTLRHYDALVDYSTVYANLNEVSYLSSVEQTPPTFATRLGTAFTEGWRGFTSGMEGIALALAYGWMWLVFLAVIIVLVAVLRRKYIHWPKKLQGPKKPGGPDNGPQ